jgi:hypothetical protein
METANFIYRLPFYIGEEHRLMVFGAEKNIWTEEG